MSAVEVCAHCAEEVPTGAMSAVSDGLCDACQQLIEENRVQMTDHQYRKAIRLLTQLARSSGKCDPMEYARILTEEGRKLKEELS